VKIASGYLHGCNSAAFVVGPTGLGYDRAGDTLYVAATADNAIYQIAGASTLPGDAGKGFFLVSDNFHGPLGLVRANDGDLITAQGDAFNIDATQPSQIVEVTALGGPVSKLSLDPALGSAFGVALHEAGTGFGFAAVNDDLNAVEIWNVP
jgi:hypothetical protein